MSDFHAFEADSGLVHHLIHNQNGTIETSLIELICNSVDAKSKIVKVILTETHFEISDEGNGFKDKEEIMKFFKRFGTPHDEGDATFGRFRIGRGQIISFSDATWHSKEYKMETCIKEGAYGFNLIEDKTDYMNGCKVYGEFKTKIKSWDLSSIKKEIINKLKYMDAKILLNGIPITESDLNWDYEDDDFKLLWNPNREDGIKLYSQGVFVKDIKTFYFDLNADIVTKNALKLNMARNEINANDPVWKKINDMLVQKSQENAKKKGGTKKLDEKVRRGMINQLREGLIRFDDASQISLLRDCRGHTFSISSLLNKKIPFSISNKEEKRKAEWLSTQGAATILDSDELRLWGVEDSSELINKLLNILNRDDEINEIRSYNYYYNKLCSINCVSFDSLILNINDHMTTINNKDLNKRETAARNAIQSASNTMAKRLSNLKNENINKRKIIIGESAIADGWTDSISYIVVTRKMLKLLDSGYYGAVQITLLLLHEYIHNKSSFDSHEHDFEFYKEYHDLSSYSYGRNEITGHVASTLMNKYNNELCLKMEALPKEIYKNFKYPVVNDLDEYELILGEKGISKLGMFILEMMPYNYKKTKNKLTIKKPVMIDWKIRKRYKNNILKLIKKEGYEVQGYKELSYMDNYQEALSLAAENEGKAIEWWLEKNGHDKTLSDQINSLSGDDDLIRLLVQDNNSDVIYYTKSSLSRIKVQGSKNHHFNFRVGHIGSFYRYGTRKPENISTSKIERFSEVKEAITEIVNGLTNDKERDEFIKQFFSKDFQKETIKNK